jgi:single-strand DNA-binding protein
MFGKRAEVINKYLHKGDQLFVEGRLKLDSWQDKEGNKRSRLRVFVENFEFMGGGKGQGSGGSSGSSGGEADVSNNAGQEPFGGEAADDIPF